ncbi:MAG: 7-cyano-7-deazaguanine synthase QueC [Sphaerobacter sp.]|nr:7-cyano-7-deazaguanine synthase QueC [Sphaerobacter sp.]
MHAQTHERPGAVVLLSGGLDSTTVAYLARASGYAIYALSFDYGQRHRRELEAAAAVARAVDAVEHRVVRIDLGAIGGSSLTGDGHIPTTPEPGGIPSTWVPARNHIFLAVASGYAEVVGAQAVYIGVSQVDYSGYPDCRGEFLAAYQRAADLASKQFVETGRSIPVVAPLLYLSKAGAIQLGLALGVDYGLTWSCYRGEAVPCGVCDSCRLRAAAFAAVGVPDPLLDPRR